MPGRFFLCFVFACGLSCPVWAQSLASPMTLAKASPLIHYGQPLIDTNTRETRQLLRQHGTRIALRQGDETKPGPSLFYGRMQGSMFEQLPRPHDPTLAISHKGVIGLRDLIASAEAGRAGYDAVQHGARIKPRKRPTEMTLREIFHWIEATPGQPHAIGRYQMIPNTLRHVTTALGIRDDVIFSPLVQDRCADFLLEQAGLSAFLSGELGRRAFMNNIAKIWAGLPNDTGRSHYHGYAGNKAVLSWARFDAQMARIFPRS